MSKKIKTPEEYLNIKNSNEYIIKAELLRQERENEFKAIATLYSNQIINLKQAINLKTKVTEKYIKKRLKLK